MITINVADLPIISAEDAAIEADADVCEFAQPGLYKILVGSRGMIEEITYIGNDTVFQIPSLEDVQEEFCDLWGVEAEYFEEFYGYEIDPERGLEFSFTEEDYDLYVRVG